MIQTKQGILSEGKYQNSISRILALFCSPSLETSAARLPDHPEHKNTYRTRGHSVCAELLRLEVGIILGGLCAVYPDLRFFCRGSTPRQKQYLYHETKTKPSGNRRARTRTSPGDFLIMTRSHVLFPSYRSSFSREWLHNVLQKTWLETNLHARLDMASSPHYCYYHGCYVRLLLLLLICTTKSYNII